MPKPPRSWGTHSPPPQTQRKDCIFNFGRQNSNTWCQNSNTWCHNSNIKRQNSNMWDQNSNISKFWPQIQINEFWYHENILLYEENSRYRRFDTHPPPHQCYSKIKTPTPCSIRALHFSRIVSRARISTRFVDVRKTKSWSISFIF